MLNSKEVKAYMLLVGLVIIGLSIANVTATKVIHLGIDFPFSNLAFSIFTYPLIDCICELWGKRVAQQTVWLALVSQIAMMFLLQLSIFLPHATFWGMQNQYKEVLSSSGTIVIASILAFLTSQFLDIFIYQRVKQLSQGKWLWLRSNASTFFGQIVDSSIFIAIVFYSSHHKLEILTGSIIVKFILSILMTPVVYCIVIAINKYLKSNTLAFKGEAGVSH